MVVLLIKCFHTLLAHPGCKHFRMTLQVHFTIQTLDNRLMHFIVTTIDMLKSHEKEWGYYQNETLPTQSGMKSSLILLDHGLQKPKTLVVTSMR